MKASWLFNSHTRKRITLLYHPLSRIGMPCAGEFQVLTNSTQVTSLEKRKERIQPYLRHQSVASIIGMDLIQKHAGRNGMVHINVLNVLPLGYVGLHHPGDARIVRDHFGVEPGTTRQGKDLSDQHR